MRRTAALICALVLILLLPGCTLVRQAGNLMQQAGELPVAACLQAAADGDEGAFRSYPALSEETMHGGYETLHAYLEGTQVLSARVQSCNVNSSVGTGGNTSTISARVLVTLEQRTVLLDIVYQENSKGSGFSQFLCSIGIG